MRTFTAIRAAGLGGLATAAMVVAHGGGSLASDPLWLGAGLAGAVGALLAGHLCWRLVASAGAAPAAVPLPLLAAGLLAAQICAHAGLLAAGAPAHSGATGSLALHAVLALAAALLVRLLERQAAHVLAARGSLPARLPGTRLRPPQTLHAATRRAPYPVGGRAPPEPA